MQNWFSRFFRCLGIVSRRPISAECTTTTQAQAQAQVQVSVEALKARGNALLNEDRLAEALNYYRQASAIKPDDVDALVNMGFVLSEQQLFLEAAKPLKQATALAPQSADALYLLGIVSEALKDSGAAIQAFESALKTNERFDRCRRDLCRVLFFTGQFIEAKTLITEGIALNPTYADFHFYLGNLLFHERLLEDALVSYKNALAIHPENAEIHHNLGKIFLERGQLDAALESHYKACLLNTGKQEYFGSFLFTLNNHPDKSATEIFSHYIDYNTRFGLPMRAMWPTHSNSRQRTRRLKIGYVSPDFRFHSTRHFLEPLLENHNKSVVEVYAYAELEYADEVTARYKTYVEHWIPTIGMTTETLCAQIQSDQIDILVDLAGHTTHNRLDTFARKPAPIAVSWLGFGYTTGLTAIDYFLTNVASTPIGHEGLFSETPWRVPTPDYVYRPSAGMGAVSSLPAFNRGYVTLGTLTRSVRINRRTIRVWAAILKRIEGAKLVVDSRNFQGASEQAALANLFADHGIARDRLEIGCHSPPWDVLRSIDIGLDCFPHNSGTTLCETLYMGVPFVTLAGRPSVGRLGSAILEGVGHAEWIARTEEEYVEKTVALASDLESLSVTRANLRPQMEASLLMDEPAFAKKIEDAYGAMFSKWCDQQSECSGIS